MQYKAKADTPFFEDTSIQMKKTYNCLYNHDMGSIPQCLTPALTSCDQQVTRQQVQQFVRDVADTNVDAVLCCPTMLRRVLWRSEIDPHWQKEGTLAMTEFVRNVRDILDRHGAQHGKHLSLCVSVPSTLELCSVVGLDMALWDKERLIDQVRVSPGYVASFDLDLENFCNKLEHARIYGNLQGTWAVQKDIGGHRQTTPEIYETGAFSFLKRGADGIAFDNFTFTYPTVQGNWLKPGRTDGGCEPPRHILQHIGDVDYLATRPKHYFIGCRNIGWRPEGIGRFPMMNRIETTMAIYDDILCGQFTSAVLRVVSGERCDDIKMAAQFNGVALSEFDHRGELFEPLTDHGLPNTDEVRHFRVPLDKVKTGDNALCIETRDTPRPVEFIAVELALYVD